MHIGPFLPAILHQKGFSADWYHWEVQYSSSPSEILTLFYFCHFDLGFGAVFIFPTAGFMIESFS
jgi:hypothetical protein